MQTWVDDFGCQLSRLVGDSSPTLAIVWPAFVSSRRGHRLLTWKMGLTVVGSLLEFTGTIGYSGGLVDQNLTVYNLLLQTSLRQKLWAQV